MAGSPAAHLKPARNPCDIPCDRAAPRRRTAGKARRHAPAPMAPTARVDEHRRTGTRRTEDLLMTIDDALSLPDLSGHFGPFGGRFAPEALIAALDELAAEFAAAQRDPAFQAELRHLLTTYAGRPSLLTEAKRFGAESGGAQILLKR